MTLQHIHEKLEALERSQADLFMVSLLSAKEALTVDDAAKLSGKSERTIREWCNGGVLTHSNRTLGTDAIQDKASKLLKKVA